VSGAVPPAGTAQDPRLGAYWWAALYQQRPSPASGSIFLRQWIRPPFPREDGSLRHYALLALSCDLSFKGEAESDYCGFCLAGLLAPPARHGIPRSGEPQGPQRPKELEIEVLWAARHRFGLPEVIRFLLGCLQALEQQGLRPNAVLIEDAANGPAVLQSLRRRVPGMLPITARGSKETRAHAVAPLVEAGQIRFHHRAQPLVEEAIRFPKGSKDLVDAFCHGALWLEGRYWKAQGIQPVVTPLLVTQARRRCCGNGASAGRRAMPGQSSWRSTSTIQCVTRPEPRVSGLRASGHGGKDQSTPMLLPMPLRWSTWIWRRRSPATSLAAPFTPRKTCCSWQ
jgi:predicted phage terminase large subunit-like protein